MPFIWLQILGFRTRSGRPPKEPSPEPFETIGEMLRRQGWMSEFGYLLKRVVETKKYDI